MIKKLMVVFFGAFAVLIVLAVMLHSGKMLLLRSPDGKTVYELRLQDGKFQHALRHGGVQLFLGRISSFATSTGTRFCRIVLASNEAIRKRANSKSSAFPTACGCSFA